MTTKIEQTEWIVGSLNGSDKGKEFDARICATEMFHEMVLHGQEMDDNTGLQFSLPEFQTINQIKEFVKTFLDDQTIAKIESAHEDMNKHTFSKS